MGGVGQAAACLSPDEAMAARTKYPHRVSEELKFYFDSLSEYKCNYTIEEEASLHWKMTRGPKKARKAARDILIRSQLRLLVRLCLDFHKRNYHHSLEELIAFANLNLIKIEPS